MGMISLFGKSALDSALSSFKSFSNSINQSINDFEWDDIDAVFENAQKRFDKSMKKLKNRVRSTDTELVINIPYNRNTDTLSTTIEDGQFKAVVRSEDGTVERNTNIFIGEDVDVDSVTRKYDDEKHLMFFTFKKLVED